VYVSVMRRPCYETTGISYETICYETTVYLSVTRQPELCVPLLCDDRRSVHDLNSYRVYECYEKTRIVENECYETIGIVCGCVMIRLEECTVYVSVMWRPVSCVSMLPIDRKGVHERYETTGFVCPSVMNRPSDELLRDDLKSVLLLDNRKSTTGIVCASVITQPENICYGTIGRVVMKRPEKYSECYETTGILCASVMRRSCYEAIGRVYCYETIG
ncbi:hypothetical protein L9F63_019013, partial [Diploptera punctata]